jgi:emp24/gp25L/p24 family/GOLD
LLAEAADQAKGAHGASHRLESEEWDLDDYEGIDAAEMDATARHYSVINARDGTRARSGAGGEYDELGRNVLQEHEIDTIFSVRRFSICVTSSGPREPGIRRRVRLIVRKGSAAHDYHRLAKTEHMTSLEVSLHQISAELHDLLAQLELAHRMEEALRVMHYRTNRWVVTYAVVSVAIVFATGIFQARYTKGLLKSKKML